MGHQGGPPAGHAALGLQLDEDRQRFSSSLLSVGHIPEKGVRGFSALCKANALLHWHGQKTGFEFGDFHVITLHQTA